MEISVCIVLMAVSLVMGGVAAYFWLSRKYAQEISNLEVEILEVQRKGNHYKENIEDKLLHAQNAAEDRKRELLASVQAQKASDNKTQQFQTQAKEKSALLNEANAELKKLRKDVEKNARDKEGWIKEKAGLVAEKSELLSEKERLLAENEFWMNEFDTKKHLLMNEEIADNEHFTQEEEVENSLVEMENEEVVSESWQEMENEEVVSESWQEMENEEVVSESWEEMENEEEEESSEAILPDNDPNLLMGQVKEAEEEIVSADITNAEEEMAETSQVLQNESIIEEEEIIQPEIDSFPNEANAENEEETVIMNIPYLAEKVIETE